MMERVRTEGKLTHAPVYLYKINVSEEQIRTA